MNGLLVRTDRGNQSVTFDLSAFVTDWEAARKTFVTTIAERFREPLESLSEEGYLTASPEVVALNRDGLLRVDSLLPRFFLPEHAGIRYT